jgi:hypothetical protein
MIYAFPHFEKFIAFVIERQRIYVRRASGKSAPWTKDPILAKYRFCNVYREFDRVTLWIAKYWRDPHMDHPDLWFAMVIARLVNYPFTLAQMGFPQRWDRDKFLRTMHGRKKEGLKTFGSAYIVSTNGIAKDKAEYLADSVLDPMWERRKSLRPRTTDSLRSFIDRLLEQQGMGTFMAAQIVADLKYVEPLKSAKDWWTFASSGPGSRRGMSYVMGFSPKMRWKEHEWKEALGELAELVRPHLKEAGMPRMHAQDLQNCLCEFSKYRRTQLGTGKPKQRFVPHDE